MTLLRLRNVYKIFHQDGFQLQVLKNINLEIKKGEFAAIMGPSGSGKSTLMYIMGCLDTPTEGEVILEEERVSGLKEERLAKIRNRKIGFVFQTFNLLPRTSALANVLLPTTYSENQENYRTKAERLLSHFGLGERLSHTPNQLSGGEQQRVAIARALINDPGLILADEPTGNLDTKSGQEVLNVFRQLNREGKTIILVTHDPKVAQVAQRLIRIQDGKIV